MVRTLIIALTLFPYLAIAAELPLPRKEVLPELRKGGYVIYIRHTKTHSDQADTDPLNVENVKAQRQLTDEGRRQAKGIGESMRTLKVPVSQVVTSKFYRAYETGKLLDVAEVTTSIDISEGGLVVTPDENNRRTKALQQLLSTTPAAGKNLVIVSHRPNLVDAAGPALLDVREGEAIVFKPLGDSKFTVAARLLPGKWMELAD